MPENLGAGEGNRTLVFSLEGCCSTIELHPRLRDALSCRRAGLNRHAADYRSQQCLRAALATEYGAVQSSENSENSARVNRQPRGLARFGSSPG